MDRFTRLYRALDASTRSSEKHDALVRYFSEVDPEDGAWAVALFTGRRPKRGVSHKILRAAVSEASGIPEWLIRTCHESVGDSAENFALLLPAPSSAKPSASLEEIIRDVVIPLRAMPDEQKGTLLKELWETMAPDERFVLFKLISGEMRVGVQQRTVARALAAVAEDPDVDAAIIEHRLSGVWSPSSESYRALLAPLEEHETGARPYPFFLASPIDDDAVLELGAPNEWIAEHKWDGVRAQLIHRADVCTLWSRGDEPMTDGFPELIQLGGLLPNGTVLDGEVLAYEHGRPLPFNTLQKRILRKQRDVMLFDDIPVVFMAYDLLEHQGRDLRARPLQERLERLEMCLRDLERTHAPQRHIARSTVIPFESWDDLALTRSRSREQRVEGVMIKRRDAPYRTGRVRGDWWKWKIDPYVIDAVLVYAQLGSGKRATRFTDYTFALWDRDPSSHDDATLTPCAKAYSGLTNQEIERVDALIRKSIVGKRGPIRVVEPTLVFELAFEGVQRSTRHKAGISLRFPRIARWRTDKPIREADTIATLEAMLQDDRS